MSRRRLAWIAVIAAVALALFGLLRRPQRQVQAPTPPVPVETARVALGSVVERLAVTGNVQADKQAALTAQVPGRVVSVAVQEGDRVSPGQGLVQLETADYRATVEQARAGVYAARTRLAQARTAAIMQSTESSTSVKQAEAALTAARNRLEIVRQGARTQERMMAENTVTQAKANHDNALSNLRRVKTLFTAGAVSEQQVETAETAYQVAKAQYDSAQQQANLVSEGARPEEVRAAEAAVEQAEQAYRMAKAAVSQNEVRRQDVLAAQAGLEQAQALLVQARKRLADTTLTSPLDGYLVRRDVEPGELVGPGGSALLYVAQLSSVYLEALVSEIEVARVQVGQPVRVTIDALGGEVLLGRVARVVPAAQNSSRNFRVKVALRNPGARLRPGMFARGEIQVQERYGVTLVPKDALLSEAGANRVVLVSQGKAVFRSVQIGYRDDREVEIKQGLLPGDEVIISGQVRLNEGDPVQGSATRWQPAAAEGDH